MKLYMWIILAVFIISCSNSNDPTFDDDYNKISKLAIKDAVVLANQWRQEGKNIKSFIDAEVLTVEFTDGRKIEKSLPSDEMYVAIAPYISETHTCATHYISTCKAELTDKSFDIMIKDSNNEIIQQGEIKSLDNGFFELWLPRNKTLDISVSFENKTATAVIKTGNDDKTCITTMLLY